MPRRSTLDEAGAAVPFPIAVLSAPPGVLLELDVMLSEPPDEPEGMVTLIYKPQTGSGSTAPSCITIVQGLGEFSLDELGPVTEKVGGTVVQVAMDPQGSEHANIMTAWKSTDRGFGLSAEWFDKPNASEEMRQTVMSLVRSLIESGG